MMMICITSRQTRWLLLNTFNIYEFETGLRADWSSPPIVGRGKRAENGLNYLVNDLVERNQPNQADGYLVKFLTG